MPPLKCCWASAAPWRQTCTGEGLATEGARAALRPGTNVAHACIEQLWLAGNNGINQPFAFALSSRPQLWRAAGLPANRPAQREAGAVAPAQGTGRVSTGVRAISAEAGGPARRLVSDCSWVKNALRLPLLPCPHVSQPPAQHPSQSAHASPCRQWFSSSRTAPLLSRNSGRQPPRCCTACARRTPRTDRARICF